MEQVTGFLGVTKAFMTGGAKTVGTQALVLASSPIFGVVALVGVIGWELWQAKKDEHALKAQQASA